MNLGSLIGYLGLDTKDWDKGLGDAEGKLSAFAKKGAVAGAAIAAAVTGAVIAGMNIDKANDKLSAQLGLTEAESARVGGVAGKLYAGAYGESMTDVNNAVGAVMSSIKGMSTASDADLQAMTAKVLDLATAFEIDVARASQVAGQMMSTGLAKDGAHAMDLLTASMQKVPAAVREDLLDAVDEYGPFMQSIGLEGEKAMGLLVKGAEDGMYGIDKTGDALKEFTIRATDMSTASAAGYDLLGMSQEGMTRKLLAGGDTAAGAFEQIIGGLQNIKDPAKQSQAALALFGTPLEDLSVQEIPAFLASLTSAEGGLGNVAGAADRMGATLNDNASTNFEAFKRGLTQTFVNVIGGQVFPVLEKFIGFLQRFSGPITAVATVLATVMVPALIVWAATATVAAAQTVVAFVLTQGAAAKAAAVHAVQIARMVGGWVLLGVQSLIQAARMAAAWLIAMGPVGWVIAAVIALVALIIANWDTVVKWTKKAWSWVTGAVKAAWEWIKGAVAAGFRFVVNLFKNFSGPGLIIKHWDTIVAATKRAWAAVTGALSRAWAAIRSGVSAGIGKVTALVKSLPGRIKSALGNLGNLLKGAGRAVIQGFLDGIQSGFRRVQDKLAQLTNMLPEWKGPAPRDAVILRDAGRLVMGGFESGLQSKFGDVRDTLGEVTSMVGSVPMPAVPLSGATQSVLSGRSGGAMAPDPAAALAAQPIVVNITGTFDLASSSELDRAARVIHERFIKIERERA